MLLWFIPIVFVAGTLFYCRYQIDFSIIVLCFLEFVAVLISTCFMCCVVCGCADEQIAGEAEIQPIYAMRDVYSDKGNSYYDYTVFEEGKGLIVRQANASNSYINYTTEPAYVEIYKIEVRNPVIRFLFQFGDTWRTDYYFYLPETANVTNDFIIDLE